MKNEHTAHRQALRNCALLFSLALAGCLTNPPPGITSVDSRAGPDANEVFCKAKEYEARGSACWRSDKRTAREHYARFRDLAMEAMGLAPLNAVYRSGHTLACIKYADCCWHLGDRKEATNCYENARGRLVAETERDENWQMAAMAFIVAQVVMGEESMRDAKYEAAEKMFANGDDMATFWVRRSRSDEGGRRMLFWVNLKSADACILGGEYDRAETHLARAQKVLEGNVDISGRMRRARVDALQGIQETRAELRKLRGATGDAKDMRRQQADALQLLGCRALSFQDFAVAHAYLDKAIRVRQPLVKEADRPIRIRQMLAHQQLGTVLNEARRVKEAREHLASSLGLADELLGVENDRDVATDAAQTRGVWGMLEEEAGDPDKARMLYDEGIASLEKLAQKDDLDTRGRRTLIQLRVRRAALGDARRRSGDRSE